MSEDSQAVEWFDRRGAPPPTTRPRFGIHKRGVMSINRPGYEALGSPSHIRVGFDNSRQLIVVKPADPDDPNAYALRQQPKSTSFLFTGTAFAKHHGIPIGRPRKYWAEIRGDMLVVDLTQEGRSGAVGT